MKRKLATPKTPNRPSKKSKTAASALKEPGADYARNTEVPTFFGQPMLKGERTSVDPAQIDPKNTSAGRWSGSSKRPAC